MGHKNQITLISNATGETPASVIRIFDIKKKNKK